MGSCYTDDDDAVDDDDRDDYGGGGYRFFDAKEDASSSDYSDDDDDDDCDVHSLSHPSDHSHSDRFHYDFWLTTPCTVKERRAKFLQHLGSTAPIYQDDNQDTYLRNEITRVMADSGAVLRNPSGLEDEPDFSSVRSSLSRLSTDSFQGIRELETMGNRVSTCRVLDAVRECEAPTALVENGHTSEPQLESDRSKHFHTAANGLNKKDDRNAQKSLERRPSFWSRSVNSISCITGKDGRGAANVRNPVSNNHRFRGRRMHRIKVRHKRKLLKELSALFESQDIKAHDGPILTMKFSLDGQYLATGGEDMILKVWKVVESDRANEIDITTIDPSCVYFAVNSLSQLVPVAADKERITWLKSLTKAAKSACVILPPKIFRILEEPLHVFQGHKAEILDLSWSKNNLLLSSSVDKTVCLWQVGCDQCLKIFQHTNCVTSIQFNPVSDDYFISGSLDGKVRVWEISGSRVVDWAEFRDVVTAVCYRPDGQGGIIGFITGTCRFFSLEDRQLQRKAEVRLTSKKKSPYKRITGFQFFPKDPSKVMVSSADSHFRIINGVNVVNSFKVPKGAGNQFYASFTSDGDHIISASQDSNVYMWNYINAVDDSQPAKPLKSYECFSGHGSIAIPWFGMKNGNGAQKPHHRFLDKDPVDVLRSCSHSLSMGRQMYMESIPARGAAATWPEEKLPQSKSTAKHASSTNNNKNNNNSKNKQQHKAKLNLLKNTTSFQSPLGSNAWCMVIVTAGWDGRIRSFLNYGLPMPL